jgi:hypothetical protein
VLSSRLGNYGFAQLDLISRWKFLQLIDSWLGQTPFGQTPISVEHHATDNYGARFGTERGI